MLPDTTFSLNLFKCEYIDGSRKYIYIAIAPMLFIKLTFITYFWLQNKYVFMLENLHKRSTEVKHKEKPKGEIKSTYKLPSVV